MPRKTILYLITFNFILAGLLSLDLCIPGKEGDINRLDDFYGHLTHTGNVQRPTYEMRYIVDLTNGESYRLGRLPEKDYAKGQQIRIIKSALFNNVNTILILDTRWEKIEVGLFSNTGVFIAFLISIVISFGNIYIRNKALNIALVASTMFLGIITFIYIIFY